MKILLTNHHLARYGGTEIFTYELAKLLHKNGHDVCIYTKYLGVLEKDFNVLQVPVTTQLADYQNIAFDIGHIHHNIIALEVRDIFPQLPLLFLSHGTQPFLEQPPLLEVNISFFAGVSEHIVKHLIQQGILKTRTTVLHNIVDQTVFNNIKPINRHPKRALIISSKLSKTKQDLIRNVFIKLDIEPLFIGNRFGQIPYKKLPTLIKSADIVCSLGRGAMEGLLCGRSVIILDEPGFDGMITPDNFQHLAHHNFTGKTNNLTLTESTLIQEVQKYNPFEANALMLLSFDMFASDTVYPHLMDTYLKTISLHKNKKINSALVKYFVNSINATYFFGYKSITPLRARTIRSSYYKIWHVLNTLKMF